MPNYLKLPKTEEVVETNVACVSEDKVCSQCEVPIPGNTPHRFSTCNHDSGYRMKKAKYGVMIVIKRKRVSNKKGTRNNENRLNRCRRA